MQYSVCVVVEALAASWIEIYRTVWYPFAVLVEALAASWIEILTIVMESLPQMSKPLRLRGLKYICAIQRGMKIPVEALAASWIEISIWCPSSFPTVVEALAASWIEI